MLLVRVPTIEEYLKAFGKQEFWMGVVFSSIFVLSMSGVYIYFSSQLNEAKLNRLNDKLEYIKVLDSQEINKLKDDGAKNIGELKEKYDRAASSLEKEKKLNRDIRIAFSSYCDEQMNLIRALQKDHKLETRMGINYEYLSILEKALLKLYQYSEQCMRIM